MATSNRFSVLLEVERKEKKTKSAPLDQSSKATEINKVTAINRSTSEEQAPTKGNGSKKRGRKRKKKALASESGSSPDTNQRTSNSGCTGSLHTPNAIRKRIRNQTGAMSPVSPTTLVKKRKRSSDGKSGETPGPSLLCSRYMYHPDRVRVCHSGRVLVLGMRPGESLVFVGSVDIRVVHGRSNIEEGFCNPAVSSGRTVEFCQTKVSGETLGKVDTEGQGAALIQSDLRNGQHSRAANDRDLEVQAAGSKTALTGEGQVGSLEGKNEMQKSCGPDTDFVASLDEERSRQEGVGSLKSVNVDTAARDSSFENFTDNGSENMNSERIGGAKVQVLGYDLSLEVQYRVHSPWWMSGVPIYVMSNVETTSTEIATKDCSRLPSIHTSKAETYADFPPTSVAQQSEILARAAEVSDTHKQGLSYSTTSRTPCQIESNVEQTGSNSDDDIDETISQCVAELGSREPILLIMQSCDPHFGLVDCYEDHYQQGELYLPGCRFILPPAATAEPKFGGASEIESNDSEKNLASRDDNHPIADGATDQNDREGSNFDQETGNKERSDCTVNKRDFAKPRLQGASQFNLVKGPNGIPVVALPLTWEESMSDVVRHTLLRVKEPGKPVIIAVCGSKGLGKSTYARVLLNRLLSATREQMQQECQPDIVYEGQERPTPAIAFLDTDLGQPEFTPPGMLSLTMAQEPVFGPPHTHMRLPMRSYYLGDISPKDEPQLFLEAVRELFNCCYQKWFTNSSECENLHTSINREGLNNVSKDNNISGSNNGNGEAQSMSTPMNRTKNNDGDSMGGMRCDEVKNSPLAIILNTHGWVKGMGQDLLHAILDYVHPDHIVQITSDTKSHIFSVPGARHSRKSHIIHPWHVCIPQQSKSAAEQRALRLISYFLGAEGKSQSAASDSGTDKVTFPSNAAVRASIPLSLVSARTYEIDCRMFRVHCLISKVAPSEIYNALNGMIVGLGVDPYFVPDRERARGPECILSPALVPCVGIGVVRSVDPVRGKLHVLSPVAYSLLELVNTLLLGTMSMPQEVTGEPFPWIPTPYFCSDVLSAPGAGAGPMHSRNNIKRVGQH